MATSFAAAGASFWYKKRLSDEGTVVLISSGNITENDYGEKIPGDFTVSGSYFTRSIFAQLTEKEREFLPEGNRQDAVYNIFVDTGSSLNIEDRIQISGTANQYEVVQLFDVNTLGDTNIYKKVRVVQLR